MRTYKQAEYKPDTAGSKEVEDGDMKKKEIIKRRRSLQRNISLKSKLDSCDSGHRLNPILTNKLDEVLNEGILDSFLPYICAPQTQSNVPKNSTVPSTVPTANQAANPSTSNSTAINTNNLNRTANKTVTNLNATQKQQAIVLNVSGDTKKGSLTNEFSFNKSIRKKSVSPIIVDSKETEPELTIHVCDEVKNISRDFTCPQKLLVSKMGYFADITNGQRLSEMDISVHCDLEIFDWLIKWVKKDSLSADRWPKLDPSNVVPILVSSSFLQMEPLLLECLSFCHARLSDVVKVS